jgi:hypothetical protein
MAMGNEDWGNGNCNGTGATGAGATLTVIAMAMEQRSIMFYIAAQNVDNSGW